MASTYEKIAATTLTSTSASITLSSIPGTYTDLKMICSLIAVDASMYPTFQVNGDTGANYSVLYTRVKSDGTVISAGDQDSNHWFFVNSSATLSTTKPAVAEVDLLSYTNGSYKTFIAKGSMNQNGTGEFNWFQGVWRNTAAITSITIKDMNNIKSFAVGSSVALYGILKA